MADVLRCAWCEQEIVLSADEPRFHVVETYVLDGPFKHGPLDHQQIAVHDDCRPFWEDSE